MRFAIPHSIKQRLMLARMPEDNRIKLPIKPMLPLAVAAYVDLTSARKMLTMPTVDGEGLLHG